MQKGSHVCQKSKVHAPYGGIKPKRAKQDMLQLLIGIMLDSDRILQKAFNVHLQCKSMLHSVDDDTEDATL